MLLLICAVQVTKKAKTSQDGHAITSPNEPTDGPLGAPSDFAQTVPMPGDSQDALSDTQVLGDWGEAAGLDSGPVTTMDEHQQEHELEEDEQGEEEHLTDDEEVIPVITHDATGYDDIGKETASPTLIPDETQREFADDVPTLITDEPVPCSKPMMAAAVEPLNDSQVPASPGAEVVASGDEQLEPKHDEPKEEKGEDKGTFQDRPQNNWI